MSGAVYEELLSRIEDLSPDEQLSLMEQLAISLRRRVGRGKRHDILELRGLGKEIWQNVDAQQYVDQERSSWDG